MRVEQPAGARGSLKWIQALVSARGKLIEPALRAALDLAPQTAIHWRSPLADDGWAEYRDGAFLERLELGHLIPELERFWPRRGPQWDGLARTTDGKVLLVEAKAHVSELPSSCAASLASRDQIERALEAARSHFGARPDADWLTGYYQYANRLAHLYFLRSHGVDAHLAFLYFVGDHEMGGPTSDHEWAAALEGVYRHLGLSQQQRAAGVHSMYVDVSQLAPSAPPA